MPGELLSSNTVSAEDGMLVWKVDAYRVLADNYRLQAESRVMNIWAFVLTGLLRCSCTDLVHTNPMNLDMNTYIRAGLWRMSC